MRILHTSDWHLGRSLHGRKRYEEFGKFLDWLMELIVTEKIDALLVAGDVFDNGTPSNQAQALYYRFLCQVAASNCRHVVVTAGNHDSPSFLNAPKEILQALNVHVVGAITDQVDDEIFVLRDSSENPECVVCAVPYLRDRDIRVVEPGESLDDKSAKLADGIKKHYADVCASAFELADDFGDKPIPVVAMGHLFAAGGKTADGDGVRELYVGSLAHVDAGVFPASLDYVALGHLHVPQKVGGRKNIRYSGSMIPMGFGETGRSKSVVIVDLNGKRGDGEEAERRRGEETERVGEGERKGNIEHSTSNAQHRMVDGGETETGRRGEKETGRRGEGENISLVPVPVFQELVRVTGDLDAIRERIEKLKSEKSEAWLEIDYAGTEVAGNLREFLDEVTGNTGLEVLAVRNRKVVERALSQSKVEETLDDLNENEVFERCLDAYEVPNEQRSELTAAYREVLEKVMNPTVASEDPSGAAVT